MSYSFNVRAASKADAVAKISAELDKVVASQPVHAADRGQAQAAAEGFLGAIPEAGVDQEFQVYVSGSVSWTGGSSDADPVAISSASVSVTAQLVKKEQK